MERVKLFDMQNYTTQKHHTSISREHGNIVIMKLIVGLGNPGEKYQHNRHNAGFMVLDELKNRITNNQIPNNKQSLIDNFQINKRFDSDVFQIGELILAKPQTFMNESGKAVSAITRFYKIKYEDLYIVHDDLDITLGSYKIQHGKGPQVHNGLTSIEEHLGTDKFWNVRIGVENREVRGNKGIPGVEYSLQNFPPEEQKIFDQVVNELVDKLVSVIS